MSSRCFSENYKATQFLVNSLGLILLSCLIRQMGHSSLPLFLIALFKHSQQQVCPHSRFRGIFTCSSYMSQHMGHSIDLNKYSFLYTPIPTKLWPDILICYQFMIETLIFALCVSLVSSILKITEPLNTPFSKGQIKYSIANFGDIPYGKTINGQLQLYQQLNLCQVSSPLQHSNAILVSLRGDCTFVTKAYNAQKVGAKMVIIADNVAEPSQIVMADDGKGRLIHIPAVFIGFEDGQKLISLVKENPVSVTMKLKVNRTDKAQIRLWLSAGDRKNYVFIRQFYQYYKQLKDWMNISVVYEAIACEGCQQEDCYYEKQYCQVDMINNAVGLGRILIEQQLRQQYIFNYSQQLWFQYIDKFDQECMINAAISQCSSRIMNELNIAPTVIANYNNLETVKYWADQMLVGGIYDIPGATVNGINYRGTVEASDVAQMICASLKTRPAGCSEFFEVTAPSKPSTTVAMAIIITMLVICAVCSIIVLLYRRFVRKQITNEMSTKVKEMVTRYATLVNQNERKGKERELERSREDL